MRPSHGQTPPCAEALIAAGVARVVAAVEDREDRDDRVSGAGFAMLRAAGVAVVETGVLSAQAEEDHAGFFQRTTGPPPG
ncbi:hypothetical protein LVO79_03810 [Roseivivax marinus]|uniref:hypothetical protein n=1 Tax=Roseivivax marinus TaxID=1379903 RepID=UPI001F044759|nr:hypothetical protein [Roseivivax marinus]UMA66737.1 hypothetical protein LVO79_03810 [Roseivivax marinus]